MIDSTTAQLYAPIGDQAGEFTSSSSGTFEIEFSTPVTVSVSTDDPAPVWSSAFPDPTLSLYPDPFHPNPAPYVLEDLTESGIYGFDAGRSHRVGGISYPYIVTQTFRSRTGITGNPSIPVTWMRVYTYPNKTVSVSWREAIV